MGGYGVFGEEETRAVLDLRGDVHVSAGGTLDDGPGAQIGVDGQVGVASVEDAATVRSDSLLRKRYGYR